jgi:hypothetical protein
MKEPKNSIPSAILYLVPKIQNGIKKAKLFAKINSIGCAYNADGPTGSIYSWCT